jgi:hypothetical protein
MTRGLTLFAIVLGLVATVAMVALSQLLGDGMILAGVPLEAAAVFKRNVPVQLAFGLALGCVLAMLVGFILPIRAWIAKARKSTVILNDSLSLAGALEASALDEAPGLVTLGDQLRSLAPTADSEVHPPQVRLTEVATFDALIGRPLHISAYRGLVWALPTLGILGAILVVAKGIYAYLEAQSVFVRLTNEPILQSLMLALLIVAVLSLAALIVRALLGWGIGAAEQARLDLIQALRRLTVDPEQAAIAAGFAHLAASQEAALSPAMDALKRSLKTVTADQSKDIKHISEGLIKSFGDQVRSVNGTQVQALTSAMAQLEQASRAAATGVEASGAAATQALSGQISAFTAAVSEAREAVNQQQDQQMERLTAQIGQLISDLKQSFGSQAEGINALHEQAIGLLREATASTQTTTNALSAAIAREQESAERVGQSAEQMHAAALASRETVERFIALAERMRELSRSIGSVVSITGSEDVPLSDPRTTRRLSSAIRELQRAADNGLPELK